MKLEEKDFSIRKANEDDCSEIMRLITGLADYENSLDCVRIDASVLKKDGFQTDPPLFKAYVLEFEKKQIVGFVLFYFAYTSWSDRCIFMEDLYISEQYRRYGCGRKLMRVVAEEAQKLNCVALKWEALGWNAPALSFYSKVQANDATLNQSIHSYRITHSNLQKLADSAKATNIIEPFKLLTFEEVEEVYPEIKKLLPDCEAKRVGLCGYRKDSQQISFFAFHYGYSTWEGRIAYLSFCFVEEKFRTSQFMDILMSRFVQFLVAQNVTRLKWDLSTTEQSLLSDYNKNNHMVMDSSQVQDWHILSTKLDCLLGN